MRRSTTKILTTHVGSLPGRGESASAGQLPASADIAAIIAAQQKAGLDIVNEGEFTKGGDWLSYIDGRLSGFEVAKDSGPPLIGQGRDREVFGDFYRYAAERGTLFYVAQKAPAVRRNKWVCTGPIAYAGQATLQKELDLYRQSIAGNDLEDYFLTTTAPASLEPYHTNAYYKTTEEFVFALAEAMRTEYEMIANAGFIVQVDDAWLAALWDRIGVTMGLDAFLKYCSLRVAALNHALRNIPEDRIRYHLCWGSWHGPHAFDLPLLDIVDVLLRVKAQGYLIEGANARHEHEYHVWESVRLPKGKILIPGVVAHATDTIEHPELVSERIQRYARLVGKENVIAGTDCGFGERTHAQIAWAKLRALVEGAALATQALK